MLKKMLTFMGGAVLLLSLTACSDNYDAFELLERSHETMEDVDSMVMDLDIEIDVDAGMMSMTIPIDGRLAIDTGANMSMEMETSMMGMSMELEMYFRDGNLYMNENGQRDMMPMDMGMARDQMVEELAIGTDIRENQVEEYSVERTDDGYRLEFVLDASGGMPDFIGGFVEGFTSTLNDPGTNADLESATMTIYLDEDYYHVSIQMELELAMRIDGVDATVTVDMTMDMVQIGNVTVHFPAWLDDMHGTPIADHELLGTWENGEGNRFLWVFDEPDVVEFREDGTLVITGGRNSGTVDWEPGAENGTFTADGRSFTYRISGDRLTITDSARDDWSFDREGTGRSSSTNNDRNNNEETRPSRESSNEVSELVGEWNWLGTHYWTFDADGTGYQFGVGDFTWTSNNGVVTVRILSTNFRYEYTITGNTLHLYGADFPWDFEYTRR